METLRHLKGVSMEYLEFNAGKDPTEDCYHRGFIAGVNAVLNVRTDDLLEESDNYDR